MLKFFIFFSWVVFLALCVYVFLSWRNPKFDDSIKDPIRKTWYTIFVLGGLIYWTKFPDSLFNEWQNYIIVGIVAIAVDAFVILGLQIKKVGNNELTAATNQVAVNNDIIDEYRDKVTSLIHFLQEDGLIRYYRDKDEYIRNTHTTLYNYFKKLDIDVELHRYQSVEEKDEALKEHRNLNISTVKIKLENQETFYKDKLALCPIILDQEDYLVTLSSKNGISELEVLLLSLLIMTYDMQAQEDIKGGDSDDEQ